MLDSGVVRKGSQHYPIRSRDGSRTILDLPPKASWVLTTESFDRMLLWLNPERNEAAHKYEKIRSALMKRFRQLGCLEPEQLTNETFDRVARKLPEVLADYVGEPEPYFFSVAYFVYKEHLRRPVLISLVTPDFSRPDLSNQQEIIEKELLDFCLQHCMEKLDPLNREMIRDYYRGERQDKIRSRKELADRLGIKLSNLRLKAQRVRTSLKKCILECLERQAMERGASM